ncbi:Major facilitator superfamily MFS_1 [Erwinia sp. Ejp617]|nr:Major facilitator superfamily MFS_1 [Erwinia sp. Ejp617]
MLGGIIFGHLSDRFGLIRVLTFTILMFSLFTGLCAVVQAIGICWLTVRHRKMAYAH